MGLAAKQTVKLSIFFVICFFAITGSATAQGFDRIERGRMKDILGVVKKDVKSNYYDPAFHGIDIEARFKAADEKLDKVTSTSQALAVIAQVLIDFDDSHLFLIPPSTNLAVEYGWRMQAVGDKVFITQVRPGSDAEAKGLKPGDQVLSVSGFRPSRKELWKVLYYYNVISKRDKVMLTVLSPGADTPRDLEIMSKMKRSPQTITFSAYWKIGDDFYSEENDKHRWITNEGITIWRMPSFEYDPDLVDGFVDRAKNSSGLIIDLRGNGGGYVKTMERLVGNFFDKETKVADLKGRKKMDPSIAKTRGGSTFKGKLIVLVDSKSASASEIFARVIQLGQRGQVLGDVSAGAVMQSLAYDEAIGTDNIVPFSISITNADVIMTDGKSLEHTGVVPDILVIPTGADLAAGRDVTLSRAIELLGGKISPEEAGKLFKYYWKNY